MNKIIFYGVLLSIILIYTQPGTAQNQNEKFKMTGPKSVTIDVNKTFSSPDEIFPFNKNGTKIYGLAVSAEVNLEDDQGVVRILLVDDNFEEHLIYEGYALLEQGLSWQIDEICEETAILEGVKARSVKIEIEKASLTLKSLIYASQIEPGIKAENIKKEKKQGQNEAKIQKINKNLKEKGMNWVAGPTGVSELTYAEKKLLFGQSTFPPGFEYYAGGIISASANPDEPSLKSATASLYVDEFDWRNRHGKNWITPVLNQGLCGSCWAFAAVGATEALVNLFYNQQLNLDLSEQDVLSCSGAGSCNGGYPSIALNYIAKTGIVDEAAFPYSKSDESCTNKKVFPSELIKIGGKVDFGSSAFPKTEDVLKKMLVEMGPVSGGLFDWSHAMTLVGYKVIKEGDNLYYRDLDLNMRWFSFEAGNPSIGKTVWIFKNSWGNRFGDQGYVYVETPISNMGWTHGLKTPVISEIKKYEVICEDKDGDGYYWWGLGEKPVSCNCPDEPDGDDSNPNLGPLDQYGNCRILNNPPVADFSAPTTLITEGVSVQFNDLSVNSPVSWSWIFEGGTPAFSQDKNPLVNYALPGTYDVTLSVTNTNGSSTKTIVDYITVVAIEIVEDIIEEEKEIDNGEVIDDKLQPEPVIGYCASGGNAAEEWIALVKAGALSNASNSSGTNGYHDFTGTTAFAAEAGANLNVTLQPGFLSRWQEQYWCIWIDYNGDMDFDDPGELVFSSSKNKGEVTGSFTVPAGLNISTRMRVSMKRGAAPTACETFEKGEVEDYIIHIQEPEPLPPIADFVASETIIDIGETVQFQDISVNDPTGWQWEFPGGVPEKSSSKNPAVTYSSPGEYDVVLVVSKNGFEPSGKIKTKYIVAAENSMDYCTPLTVNNRADFIVNIAVGDMINSTSSVSGYSLEATPVTIIPGKTYPVTLIPKNLTNRNFWKIWVDFNGDYDFDDADETILTVNNKKGLVSANITIPAYVSGETRMRVTMRNKVAPSPCDDNFEGEVRDFQVILSANPQASIATSADHQVPRNLSGLTLYPNPVSQHVTLQLEAVAVPGDNYSVYNISGMKLLSGPIWSELTSIDISGHAPGVYFIVVANNSRVFREKLVKQ